MSPVMDVMDGNKLAKYQLPIKHKALKWVKTNNTPPTKKKIFNARTKMMSCMMFPLIIQSS
jgi:hypothetical protein